MENPFSKLRDQASLLKTQMMAVEVTSRNQLELLRKNVEILEKQSFILERWAQASETQAEILQGILDELKKSR